MNFWSIYWPVFSALGTWFFVSQVFNISMGYYYFRKEQRHKQELKDKIKKGEIDPAELMTNVTDFPNFFTSTEKDNKIQNAEVATPGQYL